MVRMGGWYNPRFRKPRPKGGRGRPPLQLEWDGCEIYAAERMRIVTHDMLARWSIKYLRFPSSHGRVVEDADPYGWVRDRRFSNHLPTPDFSLAYVEIK